MYEIYCKLRDSMGLKDADIVKATGITKSTFSDWKSGRSNPKKEKLQKIADFFNVSLDYLMTGEEKEHDATKIKPGINIVNENGAIQSFDMHTILYSICEAVSKMPPEQQELVNNMVGGKKRKIIYVENPYNKKPSKYDKLNAAHARTDIELPKDTDTSDNDIMDDENF